MIKKITLTEDHIKLISAIKVEEFAFGPNSRVGELGWGFNQYNLFGGTFVLEDVSILIGRYDKHIVGTEEDPQGVDFEDEDKKYMWGLYQYIWDNMVYIMSLVLTFAGKGGISPGTYKCKDTLKDWVKVD
jgi:hypothetical protein